MTATSLSTALESLVAAGRGAGLDEGRVRDEGLALSAAVLQTAAPSQVHAAWAEALGRSTAEFFDLAPRGRRYASSPTPLLDQLTRDASAHAAAYAHALAEVAAAACTVAGADAGAVGRATTTGQAQLAAAGANVPGGRMPTAPAAPPAPTTSPTPASGVGVGRAPGTTSDALREQLRSLEEATLQALRGLPSLPGLPGLPGLRSPGGTDPSPTAPPAPTWPSPPGGSEQSGPQHDLPQPGGPQPGPGAAPGGVAGPVPEGPGIRAGEAQPSTPREPDKSVDELLAELDALVGLARVKREVHRQVAVLQMEAKRDKAGLRTATLTRHLVFTGNPGTGKTTVARLVGGIYRALGLLSQGQLVEVDRSELVAGYLGQTATKTAEVVASALGGVLFIDEAYSLGGDQYGKEAVDTLVKEMEDHRGDLVVIVAGYPEPMADFIDTNPGLQSRFSTVIEFEDYTDDELVGILRELAAKNDYDLSDGAIERFREILAATPRGPAFGNGRFARNMLEAAIGRHAWRLRDEDEPSLEQLRTLEPADLEDRDAIDLTVDALGPADPAQPADPLTPEVGRPASPKGSAGGAPTPGDRDA
ncbi:AAA family ATPase [Arsenicicoccus sp. oral taxon 190]|uniref:AAA family ATPase n=1 Tax=Arsenicicoccus sp. oral taxon 190 TaxID=1658671 RepID=UPI000B064621|nr:AAA family ATPase [Arsenicicoccus sp. oral taxon 190]